MSTVEASRTEWVRSFLRARIVFNNGASTFDCIIKSMSVQGAKIEIAHSLSVPSEFDLEVPQRSRTYRVRMVWRDTSSIGVEFIDHDVAPETQQNAVLRLEGENRRLKASVANLTKRLEDLGQVISFD